MSWRIDIEAEVGPLRLAVELAGGDAPIALVGPNGSGKTTLLRVIAGAHPARGRIEAGGVALHGLPPERRRVGYVPQGYGLFPHLSALRNVAFGLPGRDLVAARNMLVALDVEHLADRRPAELSGGERQRVALARALVIEPRVLLLDEPLAALDAIARRRVRRFLADRLRALGRPSLVVTHDVRDVEALDAEVCVLEGGRVVQRGPLAALRAAPLTPFVAEFVA